MTAPGEIFTWDMRGRYILTKGMLALIAAAAGVALLAENLSKERAGPPRLLAFVSDATLPIVPGDTQNFRVALRYDWLVITGYTMLFGSAALIVCMFAFSNAGKRFGRILVVAVIVAAASDTVENLLVLASLEGRDNTRVLISVAAIIKWSALVIAALGIPTALNCLGRLTKSAATVLHLRRRGYGKHWWTTVLAEPQETGSHAAGDDEAIWRQAYYVPGVDPRRRTTALCLSGGGVRSACVAMGAMQIYAEKGLLDRLDYVISVSGGGFSAGARLLAVQPEVSSAESEPGPSTAVPLSARFAAGSPEFDHLRRKCSYIADSVGGLIRALGEVVKNLLASAVVLLSTAIALGCVAGAFYTVVPIAAFVPDGTRASDTLPPVMPHHSSTLLAIALLVGTAIALAAAALFAEWWSVRPQFTRLHLQLAECAKAVVLFAAFTLAITVGIPGLMYLSSPLTPKPGQTVSTGGAVGGVATVAFLQLIAALIAMLKTKGKDSPGAGERPWWKRVLPPAVLQLAITLGTLALLFLSWLLALGITAAWIFHYLIADKAGPTASVAAAASTGWEWRACAGVALGAIAFLYLCDVTSLSLHPFYRARLARTFAVRRVDGRALPYLRQEMTWLDKYGKINGEGPEFIFAAAAAVSGDKKPGPGQNVVSFVFGADYVGGPALGWLKTSPLIGVSPARIKRDLTVQAAVATSGAAFASSMGRQSRGFQTLLAASGARLGTWLPNPAYVANLAQHASDPTFPKAMPSVRGAGYFYRELLGINKSEGRLVQITDGGHYENLALVEALRRRARLIYCVDGGGDTPPLLSGLADAIRLAQSELGIEIIADPLHDAELPRYGPRYAAAELAPGSGTPYPTAHPFEQLNRRLTAGCAVRARIVYPTASGVGADNDGLLIFVKAALWKELPEWVLTHAATKGNEDFPHDSTSNQWFTEAQFAAYIELGRTIAVESLGVPVPREFQVP